MSAARLRRLLGALGAIKRPLRRVLAVAELCDWKAWIWYGLLGLEKLTTAWLVWAKHATQCPAALVLKRGRFYVVPKR